MTFVLMLMLMTVHTVGLTWIQSTDPNVTANKVYRSHIIDGTYNHIYTSTQPITAYTDANVKLSTSYCYKVSAVEGMVETPKSNASCVTIPPQ